MSDPFKRRIQRRQMEMVLLARARAGGCTCDPDIQIPGSAGSGLLRVASISHDDDCPHAKDVRPESYRLVERINRGEFDND